MNKKNNGVIINPFNNILKAFNTISSLYVSRLIEESRHLFIPTYMHQAYTASYSIAKISFSMATISLKARRETVHGCYHRSIPGHR
jgi:hypothetical protein